MTLRRSPSSQSPKERARRTDVRKLYASETLSGAGDGIFWVALITSISGRADFELLLTAAVVARLGPRALLSVLGGRLVERGNVRTLLIGIEIARMSTMLVLAATYAAGASSWWLLAIISMSYVFGVPTRTGLATALPYMAGETGLASANAALSTIRQLMTFVGPLIGVVVVAWSPTAGFAANGLAFGLSAVSIALVRRDRWPDARRAVGQRGAGPAESGPTLRRITGIVPIIGLVGVMYFVRGIEMVVHVLVLRDLLDAEPTAIGIFGAAIGVGAIASAPFARRAAAAGGVTLPVLLAIVATALPTGLLVVSRTLGGAAGLLVFVGAGMVIFEVVTVITIQRVVPRSTYAKAFGALNSSSNFGKLVGAIAAPALVGVVGLEPTLIGVGVAVGVAGIVAIPSLRTLETTATRQRDRLLPIVDVLGGLDLFAGAPPVALERLASGVVEEQLPAGTSVIHQGDQPDDVFVTRLGELVADVDGAPVGTIRRDDWFGEIGLVHRVPRTASVTSVSDAVVWRIPGHLFLDVLEDSGAPPSALTEGIADRLAAHHER